MKKTAAFFLLAALLGGPVFAEDPARVSAAPRAAGQPQATLTAKLFPQDAKVLLDGKELAPVAKTAETRSFGIPRGYREIVLSAPGYFDKTVRLEVAGNLYLEEKLERSDSRLVLVGETLTGHQPKSVMFTQDGKRLVVPILGEKGVDIIPFDGLAPKRRITLTPADKNFRGYVEPALVRGRNEIWVSQMGPGLIHILRGDDPEYVETIPSGGLWPKVITISPDEKTAFVSNWVSLDVSLIDIESRKLTRRIPVSGIPRGMAATADGKYLYVCIYSTGNVDKIDLATAKIVKNLPFGRGAARHIVLDEERGMGYVSDMATGKVSSFTLADDKIQKRVWAGHCLNTLARSSDGRFLFVSSRGMNNAETYLKKGPDFGKVAVIDAAEMKVIDWVWGRNQCTGLCVSPDDKYLVFTDFLDANVEVYDITALWKDQ
ncbi:MAG: YncE family protein [Spirochaetia bacterium]|jgi:YVTN family beta-propeller protein|nr:YncE family protein [Spirochaetia bacterium]